MVQGVLMSVDELACDKSLCSIEGPKTYKQCRLYSKEVIILLKRTTYALHQFKKLSGRLPSCQFCDVTYEQQPNNVLIKLR